jgi:hypothetical protein
MRENLDGIAESLDGKLGSFFRQAIKRIDPEEDIHLDDPEERS